jgi:hypothetical protein
MVLPLYPRRRAHGEPSARTGMEKAWRLVTGKDGRHGYVSDARLGFLEGRRRQEREGNGREGEVTSICDVFDRMPAGWRARWRADQGVGRSLRPCACVLCTYTLPYQVRRGRGGSAASRGGGAQAACLTDIGGFGRARPRGSDHGGGCLGGREGCIEVSRVLERPACLAAPKREVHASWHSSTIKRGCERGVCRAS